jgi:long-chain acyl-CoA synthetase
MKKTVLLTGATGFLGTQLARRVLEDQDVTLIALVRSESPERASDRLLRAWWDWPELAGAIGTIACMRVARVEVLASDVALPQLGLDNAAYVELASRLTHIIHAAADLRVDAPLEELRETNVKGTAHVLELARTAHEHHGLARFSHVSTAYVAGRRRGIVPEDALTDAFGFSNAYERSKYEGERLVEAAKAELPVSVFRPGMIVGDSRTGTIKTFNTLYFPLRLYLTGKLRVFPAKSSLRVNLIPVDYVANAVASLTFAPEAAGMTFHVTGPHESLPTAGELVGFVQQWSRERLGLRLLRPFFVPLPEFLGRYLPSRNRGFASLLPYLKERAAFRRDNTDRLLGPYLLNWREFMPHLLEYAVSVDFMHRSERTVFEQMLFRLESKSRSVTYHDLVEGKLLTRDALEVRREMLAAAAALRALGIQPGDRIALAGYNSTRYLTLDAAIGLVGAVSVPLYYTSPPAEIDAILEASGARLLFLGTPKLLSRLAELSSHVPVISFCREQGELPGKVMAWQEFLTLKSAASFTPPSFGDLATLRYTSGTTGKPKGVAFNHAQLRWMAQCMASLLPWRVRTAPHRYLSFLPMNHVVEGILTTYSGYFLPASIDYYFLEDFYELERALPRVRPTIFFSVPRFYERVWKALERSRLGHRYLNSREGMFKQLLRPLVRWFLLRKAGLGRCAQLIVGSAPADEALLRSFQELGIEIHDAYGLTEAPLVTLNRLGTNRLGTVGQLLPETEVGFAEDGEVLVRGPQVTAGYFGRDVTQPLCDGWLLTGDLGLLTADGYLVIEGRKKELIATSYGKKIHPAKVEKSLKAIPGVAEAMLVGEGKPYCVSLLWLEEGYRDFSAVDQAVLEANTRLSHPEQPKRWALLEHDLSAEGGELTANLKLKRQVVSGRLERVIAALYGGATPPGVLHVGSVAAEEDHAPLAAEVA